MPPNIERVEVESRDALLAWLQVHHAQKESVLLITFKRHVFGRYVSREDVLDALVAHGWTDGRRWALDADRTMQLISPRKANVWAASYKQRAERLARSGQMHPCALAAYNAAKRSPNWNDSDPIDAVELPTDLNIALTGLDGLAYWNQCPMSYKRNVLRWLAQAKAADIRAGRVSAIASSCEERSRLRNL